MSAEAEASAAELAAGAAIPNPYAPSGGVMAAIEAAEAAGVGGGGAVGSLVTTVSVFADSKPYTHIDVRAVGNGWIVECEHYSGEPGARRQTVMRVATSPRSLAGVVRALAELYPAGEPDAEVDAD